MKKRTEISAILQSPEMDSTVTVMGWVRAFRNNRFIALNDGSTPNNLQIVIDAEQLPLPEDTVRKIGFHACISATGKLAPSLGGGQAVEVLAESVEILGECNLETYPLQPKRQTMEFLRSKAHFRPRTNTFSSVFRIRHAPSRMPWPLPFINITTTADFTTSTVPSSPAAMPKAPGRCSA